MERELNKHAKKGYKISLSNGQLVVWTKGKVVYATTFDPSEGQETAYELMEDYLSTAIYR